MKSSAKEASMTAMQVERESSAQRIETAAKKRAKRRAAVRRPRASIKLSARTRKPTVSIIGVGRLGAALALALAKHGYPIEAVVARKPSRAQRIARLIAAPRPRALSSGQLDQLPPSDLIFITTPDDAIADTAAQLAAHTSNRIHKRTALHMSGALSSDALRPLRDAGFAIGSMHPLISINDATSGAENLQKAFYCVEGGQRAIALARKVTRDFGARSFSVGTKHKALYHAAAVMASGHMVALFDVATEMLAQCGLRGVSAAEVLLPLVRSTVENLAAREPAQALTGTFARAEVDVVQQHLAALSAEDDSDSLRDARALYILLGRRSLRLAENNGASAGALTEIMRALEETSRHR
ncbi:MAG: Rossmann-like and DUF2520 domain-containing protein [Pyrinomonadaceae bacterium]